jgi:hypothetical protein
MAKYRYIYCNFWEDAHMLEFTPEEKYFYIYLLTNSHTRQCGIYEITIKQMEFETGYNRDTIAMLIARFEGEYKKIRYNHETREIAIKNWMRYNASSSPKVKKCVEEELLHVKDKGLALYVSSGGLMENKPNGNDGDKGIDLKDNLEYEDIICRD